MNKKIAVFIGEITGNFQEVIVKAITKTANEYQYDVVTICTYGNYNDDYLHAAGERAGMYIPDLKQFDGIIATEDVFDIPGMDDELYSIVQEKASCPVVYLRTYREGCYSILADNAAGIEQVTRHFTRDHGFRDICYMSGKKNYWDAKERLRGFLNVMEEENIPVTEHMIFHGDYWRQKGEEAVNWFMEGRTTYPQAIICANDYMALSVCEVLRERGIRVPEDVAVSGYDYVREAKIYHPALTSIQVDFERMAIEAVQTIKRVNAGETVEAIREIAPKLICNRSCGCREQLALDDIPEILEDGYHQNAYMKNVMLSTTEFQDAFEEEEYLGVVERYASLLKSDTVYLCLCDSSEEGYEEVENDTRFTDTMVLRGIFHSSGKAEYLHLPFERKNLLPETYLQGTEVHNFLVFVVHYKNKVFGYLVAQMPKKRWFDIYTQAFIMNFANAIETAEMQKKMVGLEQFRTLYQKDELTGLLNRRGFDKQLRDRIKKMECTEEFYYLVSLDMDGLKRINDNFGHLEGDKALIQMARALERVTGPGEFCGRVGGDEYLVFLHGDRNRMPRFRRNVEIALQEENRNNLFYQVRTSIGYCRMKKDHNLMVCMQQADTKMYEEKRKKKEVMG